MKSFYSLVSEYNSLPSGNVYLKFINDKTYTYYQWSENGKKKTKYISSAECLDLEAKIKRREELSVEIKKQLKLNNRNIVLSNAARSYTGYLMMGDKVVAEFNNGELISFVCSGTLSEISYLISSLFKIFSIFSNKFFS